MITKTQSLLEIVEDHPEREAVIRSYDEKIGACLLCVNLFDTVLEIEKTYDIDLSSLIQALNEI